MDLRTERKVMRALSPPWGNRPKAVTIDGWTATESRGAGRLHNNGSSAQKDNDLALWKRADDSWRFFLSQSTADFLVTLITSAVSTLFSESNSLTMRRPVGIPGMLLELRLKVTGDRFVAAQG